MLVRPHRLGSGHPAAPEAGVEWLATRENVKDERIGVFGFSAGAPVALRVAAHDPRIRVLVLTGTSPASTETTAWFHLAAHPLKTLPSEWALRYYG